MVLSFHFPIVVYGGCDVRYDAKSRGAERSLNYYYSIIRNYTIINELKKLDFLYVT